MGSGEYGGIGEWVRTGDRGNGRVKERGGR